MAIAASIRQLSSGFKVGSPVGLIKPIGQIGVVLYYKNQAQGFSGRFLIIVRSTLDNYSSFAWKMWGREQIAKHGLLTP